MTEPEELLVLTADVIDDEEALGAWVDNVIRFEPLAQRRAAEIALLIECLREAVDPDTWKLLVEIERRCTQRWMDLASVLVPHAFEAGRRHPLLPEEVAP